MGASWMPYRWWQQTLVNERGIYRPLPWALLGTTYLVGLAILLALWWAGWPNASTSLVAFAAMLLLMLVGFVVMRSTHGPLGKALLEADGGTLRWTLPTEGRTVPVPIAEVVRVIVFGARLRRKYRFIRRDRTFVEVAPPWTGRMEPVVLDFLRTKLQVPIKVEDYQTAFADARGDGPADEDDEQSGAG